MPLYNYKCKKCGNSEQKLLSASKFDLKTIITCECGSKMVFHLSSNSSNTVYETPDRYHGKQVRKNVRKQLRERFNNHHDRYELEEKIDRYGMDQAIKHGWVKKVKKT